MHVVCCCTYQVLANRYMCNACMQKSRVAEIYTINVPISRRDTCITSFNKLSSDNACLNTLTSTLKHQETSRLTCHQQLPLCEVLHHVYPQQTLEEEATKAEMEQGRCAAVCNNKSGQNARSATGQRRKKRKKVLLMFLSSVGSFLSVSAWFLASLASRFRAAWVVPIRPRLAPV